MTVPYPVLTFTNMVEGTVKQKNNPGGLLRSLRRHELIAILCGAVLGLSPRALAQPTSGLPLVAVLWPATREAETDFDAAMRDGLKAGGFVDGSNFVFAMRYAEVISCALHHFRPSLRRSSRG